MMTVKLYMVGIAPLSWQVGLVRKKDNKSVWALGPFRFAIHKVPA